MGGSSFMYDLPKTDPNRSSDRVQNITLAIFFDGTCNNRENVDAKAAVTGKLSPVQKEPTPDLKPATPDQAAAVAKYSIDKTTKLEDPTSSYNNAPSNINILQAEVMKSVDNLISSIMLAA